MNPYQTPLPKKLAPGMTSMIPLARPTISSTPTTTTIPMTSITTATAPVKLPPPPTPTPVAMPTQTTPPAPTPTPGSYTSGTVGTGGAGVNTSGKNTTAGQEGPSSLEGLLTEYLGSGKPAPSLYDQYKAAETESGVLQTEQQLRDAEAELGDLTARASASSLSQGLRSKQNVLGAISGAQGDIQRKAAIEALPLQANIQALRGNADAARKNLDTVFKLKSEDATNAYNFAKEQRQAVYQFATEQQKRILDKQDKEAERKYQDQQNNNTTSQNWAKLAFDSGQSALGAKIAGLDPASEEFRSELTKLTAQIKGKPTVDGVAVKLDNGETVIIDKNTGTVINKLGGSATTGGAGGATTGNLDIINQINIATSNPAFDQAFGVQGMLLSRIPGTAAAQAKAQVTQIVDSLALQARDLLKGSGAISDTETQMLKNAQTALNFNLSPEAARLELAQRKGIIQLMSGIPATVTVTSPDGQTKTGPIDRKQMDEAIKAGYMVQFN